MSEEQAEYKAVQVWQPAISPTAMVQRRQAMVDLVKAIMHEGSDYGKVPGTPKPSLWKPGAEKLITHFGMTPEPPELLDCVEDWTGEAHGGRPLFYYRYRFTISHDGRVLGSSEGSCNSWEDKYRWRWEEAAKPASKEIETRLKAQKLGRWGKAGGGWVWMVKVENNEPYTLVNTLQKMAQKRAMIGATLIAVNASEFFTQDMEDIVDVEAVAYESAQDNGKPQADAPKPDAPKPQQPETASARPLAAPALISTLRTKDKHYKDTTPLATARRQQLAAALDKLFDGDGGLRKRFTTEVFGVGSTTEITGGQAQALFDWMGISNGGYEASSEYAQAEARNVVNAALDREAQ